MKKDTVVKTEDLKALKTSIDILQDIGRELMFTLPIVSQRIKVRTLHSKMILNKYLK